MAEVTIKAHTRRGKGGKTIQVHGYSRRVGRKGVHSPKRDTIGRSGEELEKKMTEKKPKKRTPEEIAQYKEVMEGFRQAEAIMKATGMTWEKYSAYRLEQLRKEQLRKKQAKKGTPVPTHGTAIKKPLSPQGSKHIFERIEDKVAKFVEKYSGRKYKRQF